MTTVPDQGQRLRRRYRPSHPLAARPPISSRSRHRPVRASGTASSKLQPRNGFLGLAVVALLTAVLLFVWDGAHASSRVFGVLVLYALPVAAVIALWWEDWPGARLRPRWSGWVDIAIVAGIGTALAALAQAIVQHPDLAALFTAEDAVGHVAPFPDLLPLGVATFTVFLQFTLVTEGWPLRGRGRLVGGTIALVATWVLGLGLERSIVATGLAAPNTFLAALAWVSAFQVLGWVVLRGSPLSAMTSRPRRLVVGNVATVALGLGVHAVLASALGDELLVGALGAAVTTAGLVLGMLFEGWPTSLLPGRSADLVAILTTIALGGLALAAFSALALPLGFPAESADGWVTYALNTVAAATIVHVGVFRRWPLPTVPADTTPPAKDLTTRQESRNDG